VVEQAVPTSEQEEVEAAVLRGGDAHVGLVDTETNGADHLLFARGRAIGGS
jgi:hypothetical protein